MNIKMRWNNNYSGENTQKPISTMPGQMLSKPLLTADNIIEICLINFIDFALRFACPMSGHLEYKSGFNVESKDGPKKRSSKWVFCSADQKFYRLRTIRRITLQLHFTILRICTKTNENIFIIGLRPVLACANLLHFHFMYTCRKFMKSLRFSSVLIGGPNSKSN